MGNTNDIESELPSEILDDLQVSKWMEKLSLRKRDIRELYKIFEDVAVDGFLSVEKLLTDVVPVGRSPASEEMVKLMSFKHATFLTFGDWVDFVCTYW
jgi:hypothetical protein